MNKMYTLTLKVIALILVFVLGIVSSFAVLIIGGIFVSDKVTLNKLESIGINIDTSGLFEENADKSIRDMSILMLISEINSIGAMGDTATLDYYSEQYGLILPPNGESHFLDAMRVIPLSKVFSQEGLDLALSNIYIGDILGYTLEVDNTDPENPVNTWYDPATNAEVTGLDSLLVNYTLYTAIIDGVDVGDLVDSQPVGVFLGYNYDETAGEWFDSNKVPITGPMRFVASKYLSEVGSGINNALVGEILGYTRGTAEDGLEWENVWYRTDADGNKIAMTGAMKAFADNKFSNIQDGIGSAPIGTILGYDKIDNVWQKDGTPLTGSMLAFADDNLDSLADGIDNKKIGDMLGYKEVEGVWYDEANQPVSGAMKAIAGMTLSEVGGDRGISSTKIGILLGYDNVGTEDAPIWKKGEDDVTGIMNAMANKTFNTVGELESEDIGSLLGYEYISSTDPGYDMAYSVDYPSGYWVNPNAADPAVPLSAFVQIMSDATFSTIDTLQDTITIGKLIPASERTGFLKLLDPNTTIDGLSLEITHVFTTAQMKDLVGSGALELSESEKAVFDANETLKNMTLNELLKSVLSPVSGK